MCPVTQPCQYSLSRCLVFHPRRTYRRNLTRQIDILGQAQLALLQWALEVCLLNGVAGITLLIDQSDEPVLDLQVHLAALANLFLEVAGSCDAQLLTTIIDISIELLGSSPRHSV